MLGVFHAEFFAAEHVRRDWHCLQHRKVRLIILIFAEVVSFMCTGFCGFLLHFFFFSCHECQCAYHIPWVRFRPQQGC